MTTRPRLQQNGHWNPQIATHCLQTRQTLPQASDPPPPHPSTNSDIPSRRVARASILADTLQNRPRHRRNRRPQDRQPGLHQRDLLRPPKRPRPKLPLLPRPPSTRVPTKAPPPPSSSRPSARASSPSTSNGCTAHAWSAGPPRRSPARARTGLRRRWARGITVGASCGGDRDERIRSGSKKASCRGRRDGRRGVRSCRGTFVMEFGREGDEDRCAHEWIVSKSTWNFIGTQM